MTLPILSALFATNPTPIDSGQNLIFKPQEVVLSLSSLMVNVQRAE